MNPARHALLPLPRDCSAASFHEGARARAEARAFLVGMHRVALQAGGPPLQSMRVLMVLPGAGTGPSHARQERARVALDVLSGPLPPAGLRPLDGELVRDGYGRFYERDRAGLRPIGRVVAGADGQLYEMVDSALQRPHRLAEDTGDVDDLDPSEVAEEAFELPPDRSAPARPDDRFEAPRSAFAGEDPGGEEGETTPAAPLRPDASRTPRRRPARAVRAPSRAAPASAAADSTCPVRALLPAPGKWVQLRHADFAPLLRSQLAAPERMGADYEIGAWLQVFDSTRALAPDEAARWVFGDAGHAGAFGRWTSELAHRLGVPLAAQDLRRGDAVDAQPGGIGAGNRFFALRVASDPTAGSGAPRTEGAAADPAAGTRQAADVPRRNVPPALLCAVVPTRTRDQAIAAMQQPTAAQGWWRRLLRGPRVPAAARREWQQRLAGRTLDEQLWGVAPPPHALGDARLREWAQRTLRLAGYELPRMADEWEIFWRCRGATD